MEKLKIKVFVLLIALTLSIPSYAYDFEVDGIYYNVVSISELTCAVTYDKDNEYKGDFVIPSTVTYKNRTLSVTLIGESAFGNCSSLTSISIPGSVTEIGEFAFKNCSSLTSISIPGSVTEIKKSAFENCI